MHSHDSKRGRLGLFGLLALAVAACSGGPNEAPSSASTAAVTGWDGGTCVRTTCAARDAACGTVSDDCGGTLQCGTCEELNTVCSANQCVSRCPTGTCGPGYDWNARTCTCQKLTCECGGVYPRCKPCL
jgi:hypothetical protein